MSICCRKSERFAIYSSCCGFTGEAVLTDSAVILLFAASLGAGDALSILTTSLLPLLNGVMLIPMAYLSIRFGGRKLLYGSCVAAGIFYLTAVSAPWFGSAGKWVLTVSVLLTALSLTGFIAAWFPLLDSFLRPERRGLFLSRMRFFHQLSGVAFLTAAGTIAGRYPSITVLQGLLFAAALVFWGRVWWIRRIPRFSTRLESAEWADLKRAYDNLPLRRFSQTLFLMNFFSYATVPIAMVYSRQYQGVPDNLLIFLSAGALAGMLAGYRLLPGLLRRFSMHKLLMGFLVTCITVNLGLAGIGSAGMQGYAATMVFFVLHGAATAGISVIASAGMMKMAEPALKTVSMALNGAFFYGGCGISRVVAAALLGTALFSDSSGPWTFRLYFLGGAVGMLVFFPRVYHSMDQNAR